MDPVDNGVEKIKRQAPENPTPDRVEMETQKWAGQCDWLQNGNMEEHINLQREVAEEDYIDRDPSNPDDPPMEIHRNTKYFLVEVTKRKALRAIRRAYYVNGS